MLTRIRTEKKLLFSIMGFLGGAVGAVIAHQMPDGSESMIMRVFMTALWAGGFSAVLTSALYWAQEVYSRRLGFPMSKIKEGLWSGFVAGMVAGGIAQSVFSIPFESEWIQHYVFRPACWGIMGGILGWRLSKGVPNFSDKKAIFGGVIGGLVGGVGFVSVVAVLPELLGQMLGIGLLGAALGFAIAAVESMFRLASLEITWAPKEVTELSLGSNAVTIGGGDDHIYVDGMPHNASSIFLEGGKIYYVDNTKKSRTELRDGSKISIGSISAVVKAKK